MMAVALYYPERVWCGSDGTLCEASPPPLRRLGSRPTPLPRRRPPTPRRRFPTTGWNPKCTGLCPSRSFQTELETRPYKSEPIPIESFRQRLEQAGSLHHVQVAIIL
jgi:hypothetical protein